MRDARIPMTIRRRLVISNTPYKPAYVVWELTLRCDQPCLHCGSRAGDARTKELSREQALAVVAELAAMGTEEVVLIGGEAYLHPAFLEVLSALRRHDIRVTMTTGGRGITAELARELRARGIYSVSVSVDGLMATHDLMRATRGSFASAIAALEHLREAGVTITANTNLNRLNAGDLEALYEELRSKGIVSWQVQLTAPLGRAADRVDMLLQPWDLLDLVPRIARLKERAFGDGILLMPGNNLGYFGQEEALLRSAQKGGRDHFQGCTAGRWVMGIESDGVVKGCPSLQTASYAGGNVLNQPLRAIWDQAPALKFTRDRGRDALWGFCRTCPFAEPCMGGCTFTAHAILGRPGNNPYCHFRARSFAREGKRERLVWVEAAPGEPFDNGRFELVIEPLDAPDPRPVRARDIVQLRRKGEAARSRPPLPDSTSRD
jgi:radical SAM protein with 4Fe4S-binding SPASM domain